MIKKRKLPNNKYSVTFSMPDLPGVTGLFLAGEFNKWDPEALPMARDKEGQWTVKVTLEAGKDYQYRYRDSQNVWHNDWAPDAYVRNEHGGDNSVVSLVSGVKEAPVKKVAAKKKKAM